ncbi:MAG TPA: SIS domain-containing protein [Acidimicrobiales bacterium]|nr:SIS domain-containing protein [Acidimicrobiales bacterium]
MCGIVAVLRRPSRRRPPAPGDILAQLQSVEAELGHLAGQEGFDWARLEAAAGRLEDIDALLRGAPGLACLLSSPDGAVVDSVAACAGALGAHVERVEGLLDSGAAGLDAADTENANRVVVRLKDVTWALGRDRVETARGVAGLMGLDPADAPPEASALDWWWAIEVALRSLDRLEVRGRDSAGLHVLIDGHGLDLESPPLRAMMGARGADPLFTSMAVRTPGGRLSLVYKAAAEIGDLGDNTRALRAALGGDPLLARALAAPGAEATVVAHTRWASVGLISQPNAHPLNSDEVGAPAAPYVIAALNGDVDNYIALRTSEALSLPAEITTDAKVIPTLVSRAMAAGVSAVDAFRATVTRFDGSVAVVANAAPHPGDLLLALRGSGQSLNVGLAEDAFVVASEAYGLVEETARYVRMDGERTGGEVVLLQRPAAGTLEGVERVSYAGERRPVAPAEVARAEITTRDIDRRHFPHFLLKEIFQAPDSWRTTLRGKVVGDRVELGTATVPAPLRDALRAGAIRRVYVIGQGTAAVAGHGVAAAMARCLPGLAVRAVPATELSGFGLADDMGDTLVVAISQSGTTTDTNRTVDLARARGATVVAIVNRRNSDLVAKADGVLYTSDGRDVEMSVASTKAFYAQIAAGWLLAMALAAAAGCADRHRDRRLLAALRSVPGAMEAVLADRARIGAVAASLAPRRRHWSVVGSGPDLVAAAEARIKLSELCYKAIPCDATEDKKHIDLSSEPLIIVCAAGVDGANAEDVAKEVAIYRAHKAAPVVIAPSATAGRFAAAQEVLEVPDCEPELAFVLAAMVGHLFGYEAAIAIDGLARPLREARAAIEALAAGALAGAVFGGPADAGWQEELGAALSHATEPFLAGLGAGDYDGSLDARLAVRLVSLLRYATGALPLDGYELEFGKVATPSAVVSDVLDALNAAIDALTRPVDAIKHQAKTVTVGISRSEDSLLAVPLVKETLSVGPRPDRLGYRALRALAALDPAVEAVLGYTRYHIDAATGTIHVADKGGIAQGLPSRTESDPRLTGSKHRAFEEREVTVVRGRRDGRTVVLVPEVKGGEVVGMTLLHVALFDRLPAPRMRTVLAGYRNRYSAIADAVTETEPEFDDDRLGAEPVVDLLTEPVYVLADRWRSGRRPA